MQNAARLIRNALSDRFCCDGSPMAMKCAERLAVDLGFKNDRRVYTEQNQLLVYRIRFFNDCAQYEGFEDARQKYIAYIWKFDRPTWEEEDLSVTEVYGCDSCMHAQCCEWV